MILVIVIMNIIYNLEDVNNTNIFFSEKKKNILMEGYFTKLLYSDEYLTSVGIYIDLVVEDIKVSQYQNKTFLNFDVQTNKEIIRKLAKIEDDLLQSYAQSIIIKSPKPKKMLLGEKMQSGNIKMYSKMTSYVNNRFVLKISGIWENETNIGITYKIIEMKDIKKASSSSMASEKL